jgi:RNA polymerase sigma-70 factor (ECF subfamily)
MDNIKLGSLIRQAAGGDVNALENIFYEMKDSIYSFIFVYFHNHQLAEDVLQETMLHIYRSAPSFKRFENPRGWIITIARNQAISFLRKTNRETEFDKELSDDLSGYSFENSATQRLDTISLLATLSTKEREVVVLHVISGLKFKEISKILNEPLGTVCWRYSDSIKKLQKIVDAE